MMGGGGAGASSRPGWGNLLTLSIAGGLAFRLLSFTSRAAVGRRPAKRFLTACRLGGCSGDVGSARNPVRTNGHHHWGWSMLRSSRHSRRVRIALRAARHLTVGLWLALLLGLARPDAACAAPMVQTVRDDPGGAIADRVTMIRDLRARGARVRIVGGCWSACTMFLALPGTCVARAARLGFHGPGSPRPGLALRPDAFERWSRIVADHYPEPLRGWYLREARHILVGFAELRGTDLIRLGIPECRD